jgi:uncharacterized membrane protein
MTQQLVMDNKVEGHKQTARILYLVHAVTFFFSLATLSILPLIINYVKRPESEGTLVHSHHTWMIASFWWFVIWMLVGWICFATVLLIPLAFLIWGVAWLWKAYRLIRGFIDLNNNTPAPL